MYVPPISHTHTHTHTHSISLTLRHSHRLITTAVSNSLHLHRLHHPDGELVQLRCRRCGGYRWGCLCGSGVYSADRAAGEYEGCGARVGR